MATNELAFKINHILQHLAIFHNRVVIILYEKVSYGMRVIEAAILVERYGLPAVACTDKQCVKTVLIVPAYIRYHFPAIPFSLKEGMNRQVLQFQYAVSLISNHSYCNGCCRPVLHYKHFAPLQISVNHGFLFIPKEQKRQV